MGIRRGERWPTGRLHSALAWSAIVQAHTRAFSFGTRLRPVGVTTGLELAFDPVARHFYFDTEEALPMPSKDQKHVWYRFTDRKGVERLGFTCDGNYRQVLMRPEDQSERHVTTECHNCSAKVMFDAGLIGWRRWMLPCVPFVENPAPRQSVHAWNGVTEYSPEMNEQ